MNTIEITLQDGSIARWVIPDNKVDEVTNAIENVIGEPDTMVA